MLKTVIVDFDGLIVDTEVVWYQIYQEWFRKNLDYSLSVQEFLSCVGSDSEQLFENMDQKGIHVDRDKFNADTYREFIEKSSRLEAKVGVEEFLKAAHKNGLKVMLATSSKRKKPTINLTRLNLLHYFDGIVTAEDVRRIKPEPDLFLEAAKKADSEVSECLVVEDSLNGLIAGKSAGMRVLIVPNDVTKYSDFGKAYRVFSTLADVNFRELETDFKKEDQDD